MHPKASLALAGATLAALVALAGAAAGAGAAAKPGFAPGTWQGTGTISGKTTDGPMSTLYSGTVRFTLVVRRDLTASGSGTWALTMKGSGPVTSLLKGAAGLKLGGTGTDVRFSGRGTVSGTVSDGTLSRTVSFPTPIKGRLLIARAGSCKVVGTAPMGGGLTFRWTATKGTVTCL